MGVGGSGSAGLDAACARGVWMVFRGPRWGVCAARAGMWRSGCVRVVGVETVLLGKSACGVRCVSRTMWGERGSDGVEGGAVLACSRFVE